MNNLGKRASAIFRLQEKVVKKCTEAIYISIAISVLLGIMPSQSFWMVMKLIVFIVGGFLINQNIKQVRYHNIEILALLERSKAEDIALESSEIKPKK